MTGRRLLVAYLALLSLSWIVRLVATTEDAPYAEQLRVTTQKNVTIAYRVYGAGAGLPIIVLHGSPMSSISMSGLAAALSARVPDSRVIVPDLPGFGGSTRKIPDYSIAAHGEYLLALMRELKISAAHLVAYSMGGGVALELYGDAPDRVASLSLVSSIGVQEFELLGSYEANHAIHGVQLFVLRSISWLVPHFGYFDDAILGLPYARNFFDSDQRPLRAILGDFDAPMLIVHSRSDSLVPPAAAIEHWRIVPHSELVWVSRGHGAVFSVPGDVAAAVGPFIESVDRGEAARRSAATAARIEAALAPFDATALGPAFGFTAVVIGFGIILFSYISEDSAAIVAGLIAAKGVLTPLQATLYAFAGIYSGDMFLYLAGRRIGKSARRSSWLISEQRLRSGQEWFQQRGAYAVVMSRFIPGTRLPTYLAAGVLRMPFWQFSLLLLVPALVWTPILTYGAYFLGDRALAVFGAYRGGALAVLVAVGLVVWLLVQLVIPLFSWRGRRLLAGKLRRWRYRDLWPAWVFNTPLALYVVWLGIRYRSPTLFTAANRVNFPVSSSAAKSGRTYEAFYYRYPGEPDGHLFGLSDLRPLVATGDGNSNLETLILRHPRAVCLAEMYLARFRDQAGDVLPPGNKIELSGSGGDYRGFHVIDGRHLVTPELSAEIDRICKEFEGFCFGRLYVAAPDAKRLRLGQEITLLGRGFPFSTSLHAFDPDKTLFDAWRIARRQWRIAFRIGALNRSQGARPSGLFRSVRLVFRADGE